MEEPTTRLPKCRAARLAVEMTESSPLYPATGTKKVLITPPKPISIPRQEKVALLHRLLTRVEMIDHCADCLEKHWVDGVIVGRGDRMASRILDRIFLCAKALRPRML